MTRDIRDPIEVYKRLMYEKTAWNCGILEAADRMELPHSQAEWLPPGSPEIARVNGRPEQNGPQGGVQ